MSRQAFVFSGPAAMTRTPRLGSTPSRPWASARFTASRMAAKRQAQHLDQPRHGDELPAAQPAVAQHRDQPGIGLIRQQTLAAWRVVIDHPDLLVNPESPSKVSGCMF